MGTHTHSAGSSAHAARLHSHRARARAKRPNPLLRGVAKVILTPFFRAYFRLHGTGFEHLPRRGPLLLAANHRSFLDPFVIGALVHRPVHFVAKRELFARRWQAWLLSRLGAFPIDRGASDEEAMATARAILRRGGCVLIFPEGTRVRRGPLREPHRGVGRLALETGAPVAPIAVIGTDQVRRHWRIRPRRVTLRCGRPLRFPTDRAPAPRTAAMATERVWACVELQWQWLGGAPAAREGRPAGADPAAAPAAAGPPRAPDSERAGVA